eukprot:NODE_712_length_4528_cov_0.399639.p2 type:complete len:313 gc:universal NODE_712_length_4528_cov_0.399639:1872-934(-)
MSFLRHCIWVTQCHNVTICYTSIFDDFPMFNLISICAIVISNPLATITFQDHYVIKSFELSNQPSKFKMKEISILNSICNEIKVLSYLMRHPNPHIIQMVSHESNCHSENPTFAKLAMIQFQSDATRFMSNRSKMALIYHMLVALSHLHTLTPPVAHRDVKLANILKNTNSKYHSYFTLADFGLSSIGHDNHDSIMVNDYRGTPKYMAPEIWQKTSNHNSIKAYYDAILTDIYALGVVAGELFKMEGFVGNLKSSKCQTFEYETYIKMQELLLSRNLMSTHEALVYVMTQCDPQYRPTASNLVNLPMFYEYQ